jgi:hypothetical protein
MTTRAPEIRVRLRHDWVTFLTFPLSEEQAVILATGDESSIRASSPLDITISTPVCLRCELEYREAAYSCRGAP